MDTIICPKCCTVNSVSLVKCKGYCKECRRILTLTSACAERTDVLDENMWNDGGDDIVVDEFVSPDVIGFPFEIYLYEPRPGYGKLIFNERGMSIQFPGREYSPLRNREILELSLDGRTIEIFQRNEKPDIILRVAAADGERLYRELLLHYPFLVARQDAVDHQAVDEAVRKDGF